MELSPQQCEELLARIQKMLKQVEGKVNEIISNCNEAVGWLPGAIAETVLEAVRMIGEKTREFFEEVGKFFTQWGAPWELSSVADAWSNDVGGRVSALSGKLSLGQLRTDDEWSGTAAEAYKNALADQKSALDAIKPVADQVNSSLEQIATGIWVFWGALAVAVTSFLAAVYPAVAATFFPPTAAAGATATGVSAGGLIAAVGGIVAALSSLFGLIAPNVASLQNELNNHTAFPGGSWPKLAGSVESGDWEMK